MKLDVAFSYLMVIEAENDAQLLQLPMVYVNTLHEKSTTHFIIDDDHFQQQYDIIPYYHV